MENKNRTETKKITKETGRYSISAYAVMLTFVSLLGFLIENTWIVVTEGFVDNRNMNAPFLIGYGVVILLIYCLMGTPEQLTGVLQFGKSWSKQGRISLYFLTSFCIVCGVEILTGFVVEKACRLYYWSYETLPLHITRYTSLPTSISFALLIVFFMGIVYTPAMRWLTRVDNAVLRMFSVLLVFLLLLDCGSCFLYMKTNHNFYYRWKIQLRTVPLYDIDGKDNK